MDPSNNHPPIITVDAEDVTDLIAEYERRILLLSERRMQMAAMIAELTKKVDRLRSKITPQQL